MLCWPRGDDPPGTPRLKSSRRHDSSMPGTRIRGAGSAWRAWACPATVSWSVSATASSPARAARLITSAGGSVPSEALPWTCRSARTRTSVEIRSGRGQAGRGRTVGQVKVDARIAQVTEPDRLDEQDARGFRPQHDPQPVTLDLAREHGAVGRIDLPEREVMFAERSDGDRRRGPETRPRVDRVQARQRRAEADAR